jgi:uncharacterized protein (DUF1684 family)
MARALGKGRKWPWLLQSLVMRGTAPFGFLVATALLAAPPPDPAYASGIEAWRADRQRRLASENGWLTVVGLHFLAEGENPVGSDPKASVPLPPGTVPSRAGSFTLEKGVVRLKAAPDSGIALNGRPVTEAPLRNDAEGKPDVLKAGRISFFVIRRGDRFAIRVKDPASPALKAFKGVESFATHPAFKLTATFEAYPEPKLVGIPTVLGTTEQMKAPGLVHFRLGGKSLTLQPVLEDDSEGQLFFIFSDGTSGRGTYPAGRFLYADPPKDGKVVLDFNKAVNPPCAFTPFATCPLPPKQNRLKVRIPAGEKTYGQH